jgi:hypothetical protein
MSDLAWRKSSHSGGQSADCVEIAALGNGARAVRDSKDPGGPVLVLSAPQWAALLTASPE